MNPPFLNIAYLTSRREPQAHWFLDGLHVQCGGDYTGIKLIMVDYYADHPGRRDEIARIAHCPITHIPPKPTVWQGPFRLATKDYWAASNARNTALCVSHDGYIVYVDDLSVIMPGWLAEVRAAAAAGFVAIGCYQKAIGLQVENGDLKGYREHKQGFDHRIAKLKNQEPFRCSGSWLYGYTAIPTEALFKINGWDEDCDSMSGEDYICGLMLEKNGYDLRLCPRMKAFESEELHYLDPPFLRIIKKLPHPEIDASHRILKMVQSGGRITAPNYANMRELRKLVLMENQPFPGVGIPAHHWVDGQPICEM